ncbi:NUDIX domain-containing protein [Candidatus Woesearchaeota archaeon]|nr:NUDIX domain-containing protein [Candidatus Woesearchaeota archaeon]
MVSQDICADQEEQEMVHIVDEDDNPLSAISREEARNRKDIIIRAAIIIVKDPEGKYFVHRRCATRKRYPCRWGIGCGGAVHVGETYKQAALRELEEELGIRDAELELMTVFSYRSEDHSYNSEVFHIVWKNRIIMHDLEMDYGGFRTVSEIRNMDKKGLLCPDTSVFFRKHIDTGRKEGTGT